MDTKGNHEKSMMIANKKLNDIGIKKTIEEMYDVYTSSNNPRTKEFKILKKYFDSVGAINYNPFHLYNHYFYYDGLDTDGQIIN